MIGWKNAFIQASNKRNSSGRGGCTADGASSSQQQPANKATIQNSCCISSTLSLPAGHWLAVQGRKEGEVEEEIIKPKKKKKKKTMVTAS
jgi:hypothetical protein